MLKQIVTISAIFMSLNLQAANIIQVHRYATVANVPLTAQLNPLKTVQRMHFPQHVKTIGDAVAHWLRYSGFKMAAKEKQILQLQQLFNQPLPQVDRTFGPLTIEEGLKVLVGKKVFDLSKDDIKREINFTYKNTRKKA